MRLAAPGEEHEHVFLLLACGVGDGHQVLREEIAASTLRAERALSPENEGADLPLGVVMPRPGLCRVRAEPVARTGFVGATEMFTDAA